MLNRVILPLAAGFLAITLGLALMFQVSALGDQPQPYVTAAGLSLAVLTFVLNAWNARVQSREQHTLKMLFDTRLSSEFRNHLERRKRYFAEGERVPPDIFWAYLEATRSADVSDEEALARRECAEAIRSLLNYYEFLSMGILRGDLDKAMLHASIRGIMCALVRDMADVIVSVRRTREPRAYTSLLTLYAEWKAPGDPAIPLTSTT